MKTHRILVLLACCWLAQVDAPRVASAEVNAEDPAIEQGRQALRSGWINPPWYNAEEDRAQRVHLWQSWNLQASGNFEWVTVLFWILIGVVLFLILVIMVRIYLRRLPTSPTKKKLTSGTSHATAEAKVESLPFQLERRTLSLLEEARRHAAKGDFARAIVYLFSHQLVELDRRHLIHLTRGKTNRQYLRELLHYPALHELIEPTMVTFEEVYFGNRSLDRQRFDSCWQRLDSFNAALHGEST